MCESPSVFFCLSRVIRALVTSHLFLRMIAGEVTLTFSSRGRFLCLQIPARHRPCFLTADVEKIRFHSMCHFQRVRYRLLLIYFTENEINIHVNPATMQNRSCSWERRLILRNVSSKPTAQSGLPSAHHPPDFIHLLYSRGAR